MCDDINCPVWEHLMEAFGRNPKHRDIAHVLEVVATIVNQKSQAAPP